MKKRQIILELTPLLDVILIMLFVLLVQSTRSVEASESARKEGLRQEEALTKEVNDLKKELSQIKNRQISLGTIEENSLILTMTVEQGTVSRVAVDLEGELFYMNLTEEEISKASQKVANALLDRITATGQKTVFLVFQYDRTRIYHQDYEIITGAITNLKPLLSEQDIYLNYIELDISEE